MKLNFETIKEITCGAVRVEKKADGVRFYRFTEEQTALFADRGSDSRFYDRSFHNAGIRLSFETDSETLFLKGNITTAKLGRGYYSLDVFVNGNPIGYIDNFASETLEKFYAASRFPSKPFSESFPLGMGTKFVSLYLPWSAVTVLEEFSLDDGAFVHGVKPEKKILVFGDSITQGYDALRPSSRYAAKIADALGAEEYNKAIGGEKFYPELAKAKDSIEPDYITVAYGTNDWSMLEKQEIIENCNSFYKILSETYPTARIFAITPIWRLNIDEITNAGAFSDISRIIENAVKELSNVTFIEGIDLVPNDADFFADGCLHPNDEGFSYYADNLSKKIKNML